MGIKNLLKYSVRFLFLNFTISFSIILFFDKYIFINEAHKFQIYLNLIEDWSRFFNYIPESWITVDGILVLLVTIFLILLFATKFYTYVNELDFTYENKYFDDYLILYLLWNSFLFSMLYVLRFEGLSRLNLILFTFIVPFILILFRNSELLSIILGRSVTKENYISFNLDEHSNFKNLRVVSYRNEKRSISCSENTLTKNVQVETENLNKILNLNLIILRIKKLKKIETKLEKYLIDLNKKILIISDNELNFHRNFIYRVVKVENQFIYYFNNDIQYGAKYILKRIFDISITTILLLILFPLLIFLALKITLNDSFPILVKQSRVGLHGKQFKMYKFRTMYRNSHEKRIDLQELNSKSGPLFKIESDPRVIKKLLFLRKYSLDELPQLLNVLKGDMSLVGPRPLFEEDTSYFDNNYMRRLNVLPGMTGLLQINERNTSDFEIWYKYDIEYIENWSLLLDFKILIKTFKAIKNKNSGV